MPENTVGLNAVLAASTAFEAFMCDRVHEMFTVLLSFFSTSQPTLYRPLVVKAYPRLRRRPCQSQPEISPLAMSSAWHCRLRRPIPHSAACKNSMYLPVNNFKKQAIVPAAVFKFGRMLTYGGHSIQRDVTAGKLWYQRAIGCGCDSGEI